MSIKSWPKTERPREKLLEKGVGSLSDAELLAILLRAGVRGMSAVALGRELMRKHETLSRLFALPLAEFSAQKGLGVAHYTQFAVVKELAKRILAEEIKVADTWHEPRQIKDYLRLHLAHLNTEQFLALFLDQQHHIVAMEVLSEGTVNQNRVYVREVVKRALSHHATALIVAHNHPSGGLTPSGADLAMTQRLAEALQLVDVTLLDHFIVSPLGIMSFQEEGYWPERHRASERGSMHET